MANSSITRWAPETDVFRGRLDRMFNQMLQDFWGLQTPAEGVAARVWSPMVDVKETEDALDFHVELPGMKKEDVEITLENNVLSISGERKFEKEAKGETYHRLERSYGSFSRSFTLPASVRTDKVDANFADGVLQIHLPKVEESKPRKISIR
jgi:HSP20 family protein